MNLSPRLPSARTWRSQLLWAVLLAVISWGYQRVRRGEGMLGVWAGPRRWLVSGGARQIIYARSSDVRDDAAHIAGSSIFLPPYCAWRFVGNGDAWNVAFPDGQ